MPRDMYRPLAAHFLSFRPMSHTFARNSLTLLALCVLCGCNTEVPKFARSSPLKPSLLSPGSVALEIFSVRLTPTEVEQYQQLWEEVDEQSLPVEVRRRLARNGFRVGVLAGQIPTDQLCPLARIAKSDQPVGDTTQHLTSKELADPPRVTLRHLQTRVGERNEITTSGIYDQLPVLMSDSGELRGMTYSQAHKGFLP